MRDYRGKGQDFNGYMTLADIYRHPGQHYDQHRKQLTTRSVRGS
ncbi:hypothetical protein [Nocardia sp. NPDC046763]